MEHCHLAIAIARAQNLCRCARRRDHVSTQPILALQREQNIIITRLILSLRSTRTHQFENLNPIITPGYSLQLRPWPCVTRDSQLSIGVESLAIRHMSLALPVMRVRMFNAHQLIG